jgi:endonuclease YncB( thermonuclease family)
VRRKGLLSLLAAASAFVLAAPAAGAAPLKTKAVVDHVADGDTIKVALGNHEEYVRFIGIDTPEVYETPECGGAQASEAMNRWLQPGDRVTLVRDPSQGNRDDYDRLLRYVQFKGHDLGEKQARKGWADVFVYDRPFKRLAPYRQAAKRAKKANRGVWRLCGGFPSG